MNEQDQGPRAKTARRPGKPLLFRGRAVGSRLRILLGGRTLPIALLVLAAALAVVVPEAVAARDGRLGRSSAAAAKIVLVVPERRMPRNAIVQPACIEEDKARAFRSYYGKPRGVPLASVADTAGCVADPAMRLPERRQASSTLLTLEPE